MADKSCPLLKTWPRWRMKCSSKANSLLESSMLLTPRQTREKVDAEVAGFEPHGLGLFGAPGKSPNPREQLLELERLGQVIVGAGVESGYLVQEIVAGGQHEYRQFGLRSTDTPQDLLAVKPRQGDIEQHEIYHRLPGHSSSVLTVLRADKLVAVGGESAAQGPHERSVIFYEQDLHGTYCKV